MEPDVIRLYSSSPPPLDEAGEEEEEDEFGEFGSFCGGGVSSSFSFSEIDTPTTFNQSNALEESPPDLHITSVQGVTVAGKSVWAGEKTLVGNSQQSCIVSNQETSRNETEEDNSIEKTEKDSSEIFMNGVASSDLQMELIISSSSLSLTTDITDNSTGEHIDNTGEGYSGLSNGYSKDLEHDTESTVSSELDVRTSDTGSNEEQNSHSCHEDTSEPEETEGRIELCDGSQSFSSCRDAQDEKTQRNDEGILDISGSSSHENVVYSDTCFLDGSTNCIDTAEAATSPSTDMDLISDTQLTGDTIEIHESSVNVETELEAENKAFNETSDEDFGDFRDATQGFSRTESVTHEGFADFVTAMSRCSTDDEFGDSDTLKDFQEEDELAEEDERAFCSELPPSDSFADFSSAPFGGLVVEEGENWASFEQQEDEEQGRDSWATFGEEQGALQCQDKQCGMTSATCSDSLESTNTENDTIEFGCKIHHLFRTAFPSDVNLKISEVTEVLPLQNVLLEQDPQDPQDQRDLGCSFFQGHDLAMWRHLQDIHGAHGLKFKWAGSHSNRIVLDCLGIRNILFTGEKKQPLIVPMFAAALGMLEPTKESQKSLASPALSPPVSVESILCTQVSPSLTISVDDGGISELNLDYFGPVDECSSDSENDTPLPGIDPELYELTTAKMETKSAGHSIADAFTKLIGSMEKTTTARKPEQNEKISEEAAKIISLLPDLSFMHARVLMFPSILTPAPNHK